jgi:hypothetical protein
MEVEFAEGMMVMLNVLMNDMIWNNARRMWRKNILVNLPLMIWISALMVNVVLCVIHHRWFYSIIMMTLTVVMMLLLIRDFKRHNMAHYTEKARALFFAKAEYVKTHLEIENLIQEVGQGGKDI